MMHTGDGAAAASSAPLATGRWCPEVHAALAALLRRQDLAGRCAVFDWDNTSIAGDVGDAAFGWQLDALRWSLPPHVLTRVWQRPVTKLAATGAGADAAQAYALLADVEQAARILWPAMVCGAGEAVRHTPAHLDLRAKLGALYALLAGVTGSGAVEVVGASYAAVAQMWGGSDVGLPVQCVAALRAAAQRGLAPTETWRSADAGRAGTVDYVHRGAIYPLDEVRALMAALAARGVRIVVVSASLQPLVQALAHAWAYPVVQRDVFGVRLAPARFPEAHVPRTFASALRRGYPLTYRAGKVACLVAQRLVEPVLVAGDAPTDLEMLTHWPRTRVRLVMHRVRSRPEMAPLYRAAAARNGSCEQVHKEANSGPVTLLQGRDEDRGVLWPRPFSGGEASAKA